nr:hypothetical protein [uncultured Duganella sp.]
MKCLLVEGMIQYIFFFTLADHKVAQACTGFKGNYRIVMLHGWHPVRSVGQPPAKGRLGMQVRPRH